MMRNWIGLFVLLAMFLAPAVAIAQDDPIALSEISRLLRDDKTPAEVMTVIRERGVGFRVSANSERRLEQWGFDGDQIDIIKRIAAGEDVPDEAEMPAEGEGDGEAGAEVEDEFGVGYPNPESFHEAEKTRVERGIGNANLGYERYEFTRITLYCTDRRARTLVPLLRELERNVIARFPENIANAIDMRSAHIVVIDGESEWQRWLESSFDSYEEDGITFTFVRGEEPKDSLSDGSGYLLNALGAIHADKHQSDESIERQVAYNFGHLMMNMAGGPEGPDGLVTGFGDLTETMAKGSPTVMVYSYVERELTGDDAWAASVGKRMSDGEIRSVLNVWGYSTDEMTPPQYAEAWSMVSLLCEAPDKFGQAVLAVQREEESMAQAVRDAYEITDDRLLQGWARYTQR